MDAARPGTLPDATMSRLVGNPGAITARDIWKILGRDERAAGILGALEDDAEPVPSWALDAVARHRKFRPKSVQQWSNQKLAEAAALLTPEQTEVLSPILVALHFTERNEMLSGYLESLGIPHHGGLVADPDDERNHPSSAKAETAAALLLEAFPQKDVLVYLHAMRLESPFLVPGIERWLPNLFRHRPPSVSEAGHDALEESAEDETGGPDETDEFTTLDRLLVRAIVDSAQDVEGALDPDEVFDLVEELIELNSARHRSFFELGFADVVLARDPRRDLPARNAARAAWYWSGYVNGLARAGRNSEIVELFDREDDVQKLGASGRGASSTAAPLIFRALCRADKHGEAAAFLSVDALAENLQLVLMVHEEGRNLLWADRAAEARGFMDLLARLIDRRSQSSVQVPEWLTLEVRRRQAHCFRQLGEMPRAQSILQELLHREPDPSIQSMVHTDLGLVAGGFRSLAAVRLPDEEDTVGEVRDALERGAGEFELGASIASQFQSHGHFCLGVLSLTRRDWSKARSHLELALSGFEAQPRRYHAGGLLDRTRLYQGIAMAMELDKVRVGRAAELIEAAIQAGQAAPRYLVSKVVDALHLSDPDCANDVAEVLLDADPSLLDLLTETDLMSRSAALQTMLLDRADDRQKPLAERARDYRRLLPELLVRGNNEKAAEVLDCLEEIAHEGVGTPEFIDLLESSENVDPAWSPRDALWARVQLLKMGRRYDEVAMVLSEEFYSALYSERHAGREDAEQIVELLAEIGRPEDQLEPLRFAFGKTAPPDLEPLDASLDGAPVRVLFVGGDERQQAAATRVAAELQDSHPNITVHFIHPGWSGNWGGTLDRVVSKLATYQSVVLMRYVRTEFGRRLRGQLEIPWVPCTGAGQERMKRSILKAAEWGRNSRENGA